MAPHFHAYGVPGWHDTPDEAAGAKAAPVPEPDAVKSDKPKKEA